MPIPKQGKGEKDKDFIIRCMADETVLGEFPDEQVRAAVCYRQMINADLSERAFSLNSETPVDVGMKWHRVLPVGLFHTRKYGDLEITKPMVLAMVQFFKDKVMGERQPFIDLNHEAGEAQGWIRDLKAEDDGLYAQIEWTKLGRENVGAGIFRYFSAAIDAHKNIETGVIYWPVLKQVSLTNTPVMDNLMAASLSEKEKENAPGRGRRKQYQEDIMEELLKQFSELKPAQVKEFCEKLPAETRKMLEEIFAPKVEAQLSDGGKKLADLALTVESQKDLIANLKNEVARLSDAAAAKDLSDTIGLALSEGRIVPKDKEKWEARFKLNPELTRQVLSEMRPVVAFDEQGSGDTGETGAKLTADEKEAAKRLGLSEKEYADLLAGKK